MTSVSVATLKSNLSRYLAAVKKGKQITITSHRHPVAQLMPLEGARAGRAGIEVMPAAKAISSLKKIRGIKLKIDPVAYLLADRRRR